MSRPAVGADVGSTYTKVVVVDLDAGEVMAGAARPTTSGTDVLHGGTDGGDAEVLLHNAARLAAAWWRCPVVVAGNAEARAEAVALLSARSVPTTGAANVLPRLGVLAPAGARAAIREAFLRQVIGGKGLSRGRRFAALVRGATPDVVLAAVVAVRRHARREPGEADPGGQGRDLRDVRLVIGSGGVLRRASPADARATLLAVLTDHAGGWALPRSAELVVDRDFVLASAGLLAVEEPTAALALLRRHLCGR